MAGHIEWQCVKLIFSFEIYIYHELFAYAYTVIQIPHRNRGFYFISIFLKRYSVERDGPAASERRIHFLLSLMGVFRN